MYGAGRQPDNVHAQITQPFMIHSNSFICRNNNKKQFKAKKRLRWHILVIPCMPPPQLYLPPSRSIRVACGKYLQSTHYYYYYYHFMGLLGKPTFRGKLDQFERSCLNGKSASLPPPLLCRDSLPRDWLINIFQTTLPRPTIARQPAAVPVLERLKSPLKNVHLPFTLY